MCILLIQMDIITLFHTNKMGHGDSMINQKEGRLISRTNSCQIEIDFILKTCMIRYINGTRVVHDMVYRYSVCDKTLLKLL